MTLPTKKLSFLKRTASFWLRLVMFLAAGALVAFFPVPASWQNSYPQHQIIRVEARSFDFDPGVIRVNPGDQVTLELVSTDVVHGLYLDGYDLDVVADPGQTEKLTFTADRSGTFRFRCSVTCGALHPFMIGKLQVGHNLLFWRGILLAGMALLASLGIWRHDPV